MPVPGRPYSRQNEAKLIEARLAVMAATKEDEDLSQVGAGRLAGSLMTDIKASVGKALDAAKIDISNAASELINEINDGKDQVKKALEAEAREVRSEFAQIVGNAAPETEPKKEG